MRDSSTVLLLHRTPVGSHYDWLIEDPTLPTDAEHHLWAARVATRTSAWRAAGRLLLTPLPPHRALYLTYQGTLSGGRGTVQRVDHGRVLPHLWTPGRIIAEVTMGSFDEAVELRRLGPDTWDMRVL
jgi:hypothetical protein